MNIDEIASTLKKEKSVQIILLVCIILITFPLYIPTTNVKIVGKVMTIAILGISFASFAGQTGYMNLGHGSFFGISAYIFLYSNVVFKISPLLSLLIAFFTTLTFAFLISHIFFRVKGMVFALTALVLVPLFLTVFNNLTIRGYGGVTGIQSAPLNANLIYYSLIGVLLLSFFTYRYIKNSRFGMRLAAIKGDESVAETFGVDLFKNKRNIFTISCIFPSLVGPLYIGSKFILTPSIAFSSDFMWAPIIGALLGGSANVLGSFLGSLLIGGLMEALSLTLVQFKLIILGIVVIIVTMRMPEGLTKMIG